MSLSRADVEKIAHLARLELSEQEIEVMTKRLTEILALVEQMNAVDTTGVTPMAHPQEGSLRLREDVVTEGEERDKFQPIAPATEAGLYLVPKVID